MPKKITMMILIVLGVFFVFSPKVFASHCWLGFIGTNCSHESPPLPPPPPPLPELKAFCDGKRPQSPIATIRHYTPCVDLNNLKKEQLVTIQGSHFTPNSRIYEVRLVEAKEYQWGVVETPYENKTPLVVTADSNGSFTMIILVPHSAGTGVGYLPTGTYPLRVRGSGSNETASVNLHIVHESPPPSLPPLPPLPPKIEPPKPPPLPSGGNCDTNFYENKFHVCFFDGTLAPTTASPTLAQYDQMSFPSPVGSSQGFKNDWGTGIVDGSGKSDKVSAVWRGKLNFKEGTYNFHTKSDDGVELKLDGATVLSNWNDHPPIQNDLNNISGGLYRDVQIR